MRTRMLILITASILSSLMIIILVCTATINHWGYFTLAFLGGVIFILSIGQLKKMVKA